MPYTDIKRHHVPRGSVMFVLLLMLSWFPHQGEGLGQDVACEESLAQTKGNHVDAVGQGEQRREAARKTIGEITSEIKKSVRPDPILYVDRGHAYMTLGDYDKAFEDYTKAIEVRPRGGAFYIALQYRVGAGVGKGDYAQALKDATELTKTSPPQAHAYALRAMVLAKSPDDKVKDAKGALESALQASEIAGSDKDVVTVQRALAAAHSANGDFKRAVEHQERAVAAVRDNIPSLMKAELEAYKSGKECPFPAKSMAE